MHSTWLLVREAYLRSWLTSHLPSLLLVFSLQQLLLACSLDFILSHPHQS